MISSESSVYSAVPPGSDRLDGSNVRLFRLNLCSQRKGSAYIYITMDQPVGRISLVVREHNWNVWSSILIFC
jgi:hypothetical protein